MRALVRSSVVPGDTVQDIGRPRRIIGGGGHGVEHQPLDRLDSRGRAIRHRVPGLREGLTRGEAAVEIRAVARQRQIFDADAADQREPGRDLQTVLERQRDIVEPAVADIRLRNAVKAGIGIEHGHRVGRKGVGIAFLLELDVVAADLQRAGEAILHAVEGGVQHEIADVADHLLLVGDEEAVAVDQRGPGIEGIGLAVEPLTFCAIRIGLVLEGDGIADVEFEAAAHPQLMRVDAIVGRVVAGVCRARVHGDRGDGISRERIDRRSRDNAMGRERSGERRRRQRRAPIGVAVVALVFDRAPHLERIGDAVIELAGKVVELIVDAVDAAVDPRGRGVEAIVEAGNQRAAARAEMGAIGAERVDRGIELALDRARGRLPADIVDSTSDRAGARHQRVRAFDEFDLLEIGRVHHSRGEALRTDPDAVVEHGHFAESEAAHGEAGGRARRRHPRARRPRPPRSRSSCDSPARAWSAGSRLRRSPASHAR